MKYLDEEIKLVVENLPTPKNSMSYTYQINDWDGDTNKVIFEGNIYLSSLQTRAEFVINNILYSYMSMSNFEVVGEIEKIHTFTIKLNVNGTEYTSNSEVVYPHIRYFNYKKDMLPSMFEPTSIASSDDIRTSNMLYGNLTPHIPNTSGENFTFGFNVLTDATSSGQSHYLSLGTDQSIYVDLPQDIKGAGLVNYYDSLKNMTNYKTNYSSDYNSLTNLTYRSSEDDLYVLYNNVLIAYSCSITIGYVNGISEFELKQLKKGENIFYINLLPNDAGYAVKSLSISYDLSHQSYIDNINTHNPDFDMIAKFNINVNPENRKVSVSISMIRDIDIKGSLYFDGREEVAILDDCPAKYYLKWCDNLGGIQSQPFINGRYEEEKEKVQITNYYGRRKDIVVRTNNYFTINTDWIDEKYYPCFASILNNKNVILYDTEQDREMRMIVKDTKFDEKTFKNNGRNMFIFSVKLESDTQQTQYN